MREALRTRLLTDTVIGAAVGTRVVWGRRAQGTAAPALVLTLVASSPDYTHDGASGLVRDRVQIDVFGRTLDEAVTLERAATLRLHGWRGDVGDTRFFSVVVESVRDLPRDDVGTPDPLERIVLDLTIHHRRLA